MAEKKKSKLGAKAIFARILAVILGDSHRWSCKLFWI